MAGAPLPSSASSARHHHAGSVPLYRRLGSPATVAGASASPPANALSYARAHTRGSVHQLLDLVRFPTVSSDPARAGDLRRCAAWLADHLRRIGMHRARVIPTNRHPLVYAEWLGAPGRPVVLIYGHYDVQPAEPLDAWRTPPFEPVVHGDDLYGRGASDDKGQMFAHVKALEALLATTGGLPVNVRCLFDGEEEIGSPSLPAFLGRGRGVLAADVALLSDTRMLAPGRPAITYALRGTLGLEIELRGPPHDLHSGSFGGAVLNPIQALCEIVASLHDEHGRVAIPGFYDRVRRVSMAERRAMARAGPPAAAILRDAGVRRGWGEPGYSLHERTTIRPALTINGITGGHQGPGGKGIIPARAVAKLSVRLVPDQDPREVGALVRRHVAGSTPPGVRAEVRVDRAARPVVIDRSHPAMRAAAAAYRYGFGRAPVFLRSGGTIPVVDLLQRALGVPTVLLGFALPDDRAHAPNEKFHLPNYVNGIATVIRLLQIMGRPQRQAMSDER